MISKSVSASIISAIQALRVPISITPLWKTALKDREAYRPFFQPWRVDRRFRAVWDDEGRVSGMLVDTAYFVFSLAEMAMRVEGEVWECGVYKGSTARLLVAARDHAGDSRQVRLFDTFAGMPESRAETDSYAVGTFADTSIEAVRNKLIGSAAVSFHPGMLPSTFAGLETSTVAFAHIDVDQYESTKACCAFVYPRLSHGGILLIDDYGRPGTYGARLGADEYFVPLGIRPIVLQTGQAFVIK